MRELSALGEDDLYVVKYIEPYSDNAAALGLDIGSDPIRREAADRAVATGLPTLTAAITLVQDTRRSAGFLLFVPVYRHGADPSTPAQRRQALVGLLFAPMVVGEILAAVPDVAAGLAHFQLIDAAIGNTVFDSSDDTITGLRGADVAPAVGSFQDERRLSLPGRDMLLRLRSTPQFDAAHNNASPWLVFAGGVLTSMLLAGLLRQQIIGRGRAEALARAMTVDLQRLAVVARRTSNAVVITDARRRITWVNEGFERISGYSAAEALGQSPGALLQDSSTDSATVEALRMALNACESFQGEILNRAKDGRRYWLALDIQPMYGDDGSHQGFMALESDITERKAAEAALRDSQLLLDKTGRIGGIGGWTLELDEPIPRWTNQTALIHDLPPGYQPKSIEEAISYYAPGAAEQMTQAVQQSIASGTGFDLELPLITAKGRNIWVRATGRADYEGDRPVRMVGAFQDITERRRTQDELAQARERELLIGARIQQALLVDAPDQRLPGLWLSTLNEASLGIDGDFVELIPLGDRSIDIIVGDVMGKGVAAALMAAGTKMQFSRCMAALLAEPEREGALPTPAQVVAAVHQRMTANLQDLEAFVTLSYLRLDMLAGTLTWVGCGHEEPLLLRHDGDVLSMANQHPPLGVLDSDDYQQDVVPFVEGDALFLCSDGAADALMSNGSRLGRERVMALLSALMARVQTPAAVLHALRRDLAATGARITDDLTLVLAIASGPTARASRRELPVDLVDLKHVRSLIEHRCREAGLGDVETSLFAVACVEAYTNAVLHTRGRPAGAPVELVVRIEPEAVVVDIVTLGEPFTPPAPAAEIRFEDYPEGGFGHHIMQQATDTLEHLHEMGVNTVRLIRLRRSDAG